MAARAFGSGTVSFGLVSIPIKVYATSKPGSAVSFNMLHADCGTKLKQQYMCPKCNEVVPRDKIAKGYEYSKGHYVMLSDEEIKALEAVADNTVALGEFVPADSVDPVFIDKSYYLGPDKGGERAYALLSRAMRETGLVGVARYAVRGKQYVVLVRPYGDSGLSMHQLRYADEVRSFAEVPVGDMPAIAKAELDLAVQIIQQVARDEFHPEAYKDEVRARVQELIEQKVEGKEITVEAPQAPRGEIIDLMAALKASLGAGKGEAAEGAGEAAAAGDQRKPPKTAPRKAASSRKKTAQSSKG
jgi:DNA end-binding protein Ku